MQFQTATWSQKKELVLLFQILRSTSIQNISQILRDSTQKGLAKRTRKTFYRALTFRLEKDPEYAQVRRTREYITGRQVTHRTCVVIRLKSLLLQGKMNIYKNKIMDLKDTVETLTNHLCETCSFISLPMLPTSLGKLFWEKYWLKFCTGM